MVPYSVALSLSAHTSRSRSDCLAPNRRESCPGAGEPRPATDGGRSLNAAAEAADWAAAHGVGPVRLPHTATP